MMSNSIQRRLRQMGENCVCSKDRCRTPSWDDKHISASTSCTVMTSSSIQRRLRHMCDKQTNKNTNNETKKHRHKQTNNHTKKHRSKQASKRTNKQPTNQPTNQANKQTNKQTNKQSSKQTSNQTTNGHSPPFIYHNRCWQARRSLLWEMSEGAGGSWMYRNQGCRAQESSVNITRMRFLKQHRNAHERTHWAPDACCRGRVASGNAHFVPVVARSLYGPLLVRFVDHSGVTLGAKNLRATFKTDGKNRSPKMASLPSRNSIKTNTKMGTKGEDTFLKIQP